MVARTTENTPSIRMPFLPLFLFLVKHVQKLFSHLLGTQMYPSEVAEGTHSMQFRGGGKLASFRMML